LALPCVALLSEVVSLRTHVVKYRPEVVDPLFEQGSARVCLHESRIPSGYGSFPSSVPRIVLFCEGRVDPVQFAGLNGPLAQLIPACADPARFNAPQDGGFRHPRLPSQPALGCNPSVALRSVKLMHVTVWAERLTAA